MFVFEFWYLISLYVSRLFSDHLSLFKDTMDFERETQPGSYSFVFQNASSAEGVAEEREQYTLDCVKLHKKLVKLSKKGAEKSANWINSLKLALKDSTFKGVASFLTAALKFNLSENDDTDALVQHLKQFCLDSVGDDHILQHVAVIQARFSPGEQPDIGIAHLKFPQWRKVVFWLDPADVLATFFLAKRQQLNANSTPSGVYNFVKSFCASMSPCPYNALRKEGFSLHSLLLRMFDEETYDVKLTTKTKMVSKTVGNSKYEHAKSMYQFPPEQRVKQMKGVHALMMSEIFLKLGTTARQRLMIRNVFLKYNEILCGNDEVGRWTGPKKTLSFYNYGIEAVPPPELLYILGQRLNGVLDCERGGIGYSRRYRDEKGMFVYLDDPKKADLLGYTPSPNEVITESKLVKMRKKLGSAHLETIRNAEVVLEEFLLNPDVIKRTKRKASGSGAETRRKRQAVENTSDHNRFELSSSSSFWKQEDDDQRETAEQQSQSQYV